MYNDFVIIGPADDPAKIKGLPAADALKRLQPMIDDNLVHMDRGRILATSQGRLLLRNIAMCFDRYLDRPGIPVKFSRAV